MYRLIVAEEAGGYAQACMLCPRDRLEAHDVLYIVAWENDPPVAGRPRQGGLVRLCWLHLDELAVLIAEVLD